MLTWNSEGVNFKRYRIGWTSLVETGLLISIISFGYIILTIGAWHTYPNAEDLELSCASRDIGLVHSILGVMTTYDGRYTTNFLHAINPLVFNWIEGYSVMNILGVLLLNLGLYFFITLTINSGSPFAAFLYSAFITIMYMGCILCFATFYKMAGNFVYLYPNSFVLFFACSLTLYFKAQSTYSENIYFVLTAITLIAAIGFSELYLPFYSLLLMGILTYTWFRNKRLFKNFLPIFIVGIASIIFFVGAPGVTIHLSGTQNNGIENSAAPVLLNTLRRYGDTLNTTLKQPIFLYSVIYFILLFHSKKIGRKTTMKGKTIYGIMALTVAITLIMTASYYLPKMDSSGYPLKIYTPILFLLFVAVYLFMCSAIKVPVTTSNVRIWTSIRILLLMILLINLFQGNNYIALLYKDYENNKLQAFKIFMDNRTVMLKKSSQSTAKYKTALVPALLECPRTVYISTDSETNRTISKWNKYHEEYFKLDEVSVIGDTTFRFY